MERKRGRRRRKNVLALDFGSKSIKGVIGTDIGNKIKIQELFIVDLQPGSFKNGNLQDANDIKNRIKAELKQCATKAKDVIVTIESTEIIKRNLIIPKVEAEDMKGLISYEIEQYLPIDMNNHILQYKVIREINDPIEDSEKLEIGVEVMPLQMSRDYFDLLIDCGLNPILMESHSDSLRKLTDRFMTYDIEFNDSTYAFVDLGHAFTEVNLFEEGVFSLHRLLDCGTSILDNMLIEYANIAEDAVDQKKAMVNIAEIESNEPEQIVLEKQSSLNEVDEQFVKFFNMSIDEVMKVLTYHITRSAENKVDKLVLYGGTSNTKGIQSYMTEKTGIVTVKLNLSDYLEVNEKQKSPNYEIFAQAIGSIVEITEG